MMTVTDTLSFKMGHISLSAYWRGKSRAAITEEIITYAAV